MKIRNSNYIYLCLVVLIIGGCVFLQPQGSYVTANRSRTFTISVNSVPSGAQVYLNDNLVGVTPLRKLRVPIDYSIVTTRMIFDSGWRVEKVKKDYYVFVKKKGYKTSFAKLAYTDTKGKLGLKVYKYNFTLKENAFPEEATSGQIGIRPLYVEPPENQELERVENRLTDFWKLRHPGMILPEYLYVGKEKITVTKDICYAARFYAAEPGFSWKLGSGYVSFDLRNYEDFLPFIRRTKPEEITKKLSDRAIFGVFVDGELIAVASVPISAPGLNGVSFPYPWQWDDGRLIGIVKKLGIRTRTIIPRK